jgi:N-acetylglucosamine-6-sulfatase
MRRKSGSTVDTAPSYPWLSTIAACKAAGVKICSFVSVLVLTAAGFGPSLLIAPVAAQSQPRPNVVVIMTDDMRLDDLQVMTKTKALFSSGTTFRNSFVTTPLCCPSRATFFTGQYAHNHGVFTSSPPDGGFIALDNTNTLPVWLQATGYYTSHIGKYINGYPGPDETLIPPGWDNWQALAKGFHKMYGYTINDNGTLVRYGTTTSNWQTDVLANRAVATINEAALRNQPFFLSIAPTAPHRESDPATGEKFGPRPAPRHVGAFGSEPLPKPPSFNEADVSDKPRFVQNKPLLTPTEIQGITTNRRSRLGSLLAVDDLVERVVNQLSAAGELDNTVLIFTSDNGYFLGEHRIPDGKDRVYEEAAGVPLLIRGGGFSKGAIANQFVANIDLAPTIVDLANATAGLPMDGQSLVPVAVNPTRAAARSLVIEGQDYQAVRNASFLYAEHKTGEQELYDMRQGHPNYDPYQLISRHASSPYAQIRSQLATKLIRLRTCAGANCRVP